MSLDEQTSPSLSKPIIEPIQRPRAKRPTKNSPRRKERAPGAPIHRDKPRAKDRPEAVNWDCIRALHQAAPATCVAYREDLGAPDLSVWRIVLAVKLPKGIANSLNPKAAAPVFNLPLLAQGLDGAGWGEARMRLAFLVRGPERGESLLVLKVREARDALEMIATFDPDRAVSLDEMIQAQAGQTISLAEPTKETRPHSLHIVFGLQHPTT